ncbi:MAG: hypothetical protein WAM70_12515 [Pyrinomonadaceae bacterium]
MIVLIGTAVVFCQTSTWKTYEYPEDGFAVTAPTKPVFEKEPGEKPIEEIHFYSVDLGGSSGVMFAITDFHEEPTVPLRDVLHAAKNGGLTRTKSRLVSEKRSCSRVMRVWSSKPRGNLTTCGVASFLSRAD